MRLKIRQVLLFTCIVLFIFVLIAQMISLFGHSKHTNGHKPKTCTKIVIGPAGHVHEEEVIRKAKHKSTSRDVKTFGRALLPSAFAEEEDEPDEIDFEAVFDLRRRHAYRACLARNLTQFESFPNNIPYNTRTNKFIFVDEVHKILLCAVPKAASTNWKTLFLVLTNTTNLPMSNITHEYVNRDVRDLGNWTNFKPLWWFSKAEAAKRFRSYTKIAWVRDPYERLVSAWRSKFTRYMYYYSNKIGRDIIGRFRPNATAKAKRNGYPISFEEFLKYVVSEGKAGRIPDVHWNVMSDFCFICKVPYDYIGFYENLLPEAYYLLKKLTGRDDVRFPIKDRFQRSSVFTAANYSHVLTTVPRQLVKDALSLYHADYDIFGYEWPKF